MRVRSCARVSRQEVGGMENVELTERGRVRRQRVCTVVEVGVVVLVGGRCVCIVHRLD